MQLLCAEDGLLHAALVEFAHGDSTLEDLPALLLVASMFRFIPICERYVEALHAQMKKVILQARHAGIRHIVFKQFHAQIADRVRTPQGLADMAQRLRACRSIVDMIKAMGLWSHPSINMFLGWSNNEAR